MCGKNVSAVEKYWVNKKWKYAKETFFSGFLGQSHIVYQVICAGNPLL